MPRVFEIEIRETYRVIADSAEQALASYRVSFDGVEPELVGLSAGEVIGQDNFEFLGARGEATWAGAEIVFEN